MSHSVEVALLAASAIVLVSVLAVRVSTRFGLPTLLIYLALGMLVGEAGLGVEFDNAELTRTLGLAALGIILAEGGLTTNWPKVRQAMPMGIVLATVGVGISVAVIATVSVVGFDTDWRTGVLLGAILSSTDAAAVFSTLRRLPLRGRYAAILEAESGINDAPAVILVVLMTADHSESLLYSAGLMAYELVVGAAIGVGAGLLGSIALRHVALPVSGLYPLATIAFATLGYAAASVIHASGFLAIYLAGLVLGNASLPHRRQTLGFAEGLAWMAQIGLFVLLGLLSSPSRLPESIGPALVIGAFLLVVARPLSIVATATWFRIGWRGQTLLSWAGLRGAVPIVLATIPMTTEFHDAERLFDITFVLVIVFTLIQGSSLPFVARRLGVVEHVETRDVSIESAPLEEIAADLLHVRVVEGSRLHGVYARQLRLPAGAVLSLIVRGSESIVPEPNTRIVRGDQLLIVADRTVRRATEQRVRAVSRAGYLARWHGE